jgi:hypothetical protein
MAISLWAVGFSAIVTIDACASTKQGKAYQTLGTVVESVYTGMTIYGDQVKAGKVSDADQAKVKKAYEIYQAVIGPAVKSRGLTGSVSVDVAAAADALFALLSKFGVIRVQ